MARNFLLRNILLGAALILLGDFVSAIVRRYVRKAK